MNESDSHRATSELHIVVAASVAAAAFILIVGSVLVWREWQRGRRRLRERARPFACTASLAPQGTKRAEIELQTKRPEDRGGDPGESSTSFLRAAHSARAPVVLGNRLFDAATTTMDKRTALTARFHEPSYQAATRRALWHLDMAACDFRARLPETLADGSISNTSSRSRTEQDDAWTTQSKARIAPAITFLLAPLSARPWALQSLSCVHRGSLFGAGGLGRHRELPLCAESVSPCSTPSQNPTQLHSARKPTRSPITRSPANVLTRRRTACLHAGTTRRWSGAQSTPPGPPEMLRLSPRTLTACIKSFCATQNASKRTHCRL